MYILKIEQELNTKLLKSSIVEFLFASDFQLLTGLPRMEGQISWLHRNNYYRYCNCFC